MKKIRLNEKSEIPVLGLGTWQMKGKTAVRAVSDALSIGYRLIDTAEFYRNHKEIGRAVKKSGIKRKDIFITTKVPPYKLGKGLVKKSVEKYLDELQTDYIDLLLIHWPMLLTSTFDTLDVFEKLKGAGKINSYGVSNYGIERLEKIIDKGYEVSVNQIKVHPSDNPKELIDFCNKNKITIMAYTPLGKGDDLELDVVKDISLKYGKSEAQTILNWEMGKGMVTIPKAVQKKHLLENLGSLKWSLERIDIERIDNSRPSRIFSFTV